jgi:hypothetical protein
MPKILQDITLSGKFRDFHGHICLNVFRLLMVSSNHTRSILHCLLRGTCLLILVLRCQVHPRPSMWALEGLSTKVSADSVLATLENSETASSCSIWRCQEPSVGTMQGIPCNPHCTFGQPTPVGFAPFYIRHNTSTPTGDLVQASGNDLWPSEHGMVLSVPLKGL